MTPASRFLLTVLALVAAAGMAAPSLAQPNAPAGEAPAAQGGAAAQSQPLGKAPRRESWTDRQLSRLHRQLRISQAQDAAWTHFADATRTAAQHLQQLYEQRAANFETMNALQNLKDYQRIVAAQAADLDNKVTTFAALYDSLSAEQKETADRMFRYQEQRRQQRHMARERRFRQRAGQGGGHSGQHSPAPAAEQ